MVIEPFVVDVPQTTLASGAGPSFPAAATSSRRRSLGSWRRSSGPSSVRFASRERGAPDALGSRHPCYLSRAPWPRSSTSRPPRAWCATGTACWSAAPAAATRCPRRGSSALAERFRATGRPRGLSLMSVVAIGDWKTTGFGRLAQPGLVRRVVSRRLQQLPRDRRDGGGRRDRGLHAAAGRALAALPGHGRGPAGPRSRGPGSTPSSTRAWAAASRAPGRRRTWSSS